MSDPFPAMAHLTVHSFTGRKEAFAIVSSETAQVPDGTYALVLSSDVAELLVAAKSAVDLLEQTLTWREGWECSEDELLSDIRATIAKAERRRT